MKKLCVIAIVLLVVACSKNEEKMLPKKQELIESVYSSVTIQPDSLYQVYAAVSGLMDANLVAEGDFVSENQHLFQISNNTPKLNTENAKFAFELAQENYNGKTAVLNSISDEMELVNKSTHQ